MDASFALDNVVIKGSLAVNVICKKLVPLNIPSLQDELRILTDWVFHFIAESALEMARSSVSSFWKPFITLEYNRRRETFRIFFASVSLGLWYYHEWQFYYRQTKRSDWRKISASFSCRLFLNAAHKTRHHDNGSEYDPRRWVYSAALM